MKIEALLLKAFTTDPRYGNAAGVILDANNLSDRQMLEIAQTLGFSESAFIQKSDKADFRVRFFASKQEVDFCGHATVATFCLLVEQGVITFGNEESVEVTQETKAGIFPVVCYKSGRIMMTQSNPTFGEAIQDKLQIAKLLGINEDDIDIDLPIQSVSTASPKLIVPVKSLDALKRVNPDLPGILNFCQAHEPSGFYVFTHETVDTDADFATRFFNPTVGIDEDPATGVAAGALACYADRYIFNSTQKQCVIEQGLTMHMPSTLYVDITNKVQVGGYGVSYGVREIELFE